MVHLDPAAAVMQMLRLVYSLLFPLPSTIDTRYKVSLYIFRTSCRFFTLVLPPCVVLGSDWLMTFSNMFSDLLQHFYHIDTVDTKMLASDWLL